LKYGLAYPFLIHIAAAPQALSLRINTSSDSPEIPCILCNPKVHCWAGYVLRLTNSEMPERIMNCNPEGKRKVARLKARWIDVNNDMRKAGVRKWIEAKDGDGWQRILDEANAHLGLVPVVMMVNFCVHKSLPFF
jgi:hypothetical protein